MSTHLTCLPANGYVRERWRNGAGWTREIARGSAVGVDWDWRLSIAEIDAPSEFSRFPGVDREQVLLSGDGLLLESAGAPLALEPPHGRHRYPGEAQVRGVPQGAAVRAFNLMWRRDSVQARLWHRPLVGSMIVFAEPRSIWALHLLAGQVRIDGTLLEAGDSALLRAAEQRLRQPLEGHGEALLVRLVSRGTGAQ